ncbi:glutathione S-transferase [Myxozyma melibiosi]|uniref:Glutathione S-transferase n=1 Tax=Myxozyma melibiosi TaxID=54550 RepID=A0ABR1F6B8_9ASCO
MDGEAIVKPRSPIILHWLVQSRSHRILWLLEELELPYEVKVYKRNAKTQLADPALKAVHPRGKSPIIEDDGTVIAESGLIIEYLIEKYGKHTSLYPKTPEDLLKARYYLHYAEGSLQPVLLFLYITYMTRNAPMPFFIRPIARRILDAMDNAFAAPDAKQQLQLLEDELTRNGTGFFVGDSCTGADIILIFPLQGAVTRAGLTKKAYPALWKYMNDMQDRDAYKRANEKVEALGMPATTVKL